MLPYIPNSKANRAKSEYVVFTLHQETQAVNKRTSKKCSCNEHDFSDKKLAFVASTFDGNFGGMDMLVFSLHRDPFTVQWSRIKYSPVQQWVV